MKHRILQDLRVELSEEFDRNFERKAFFGKRWKPRRTEGRGSLLIVTGTLRRSIQRSVIDDNVKRFADELKQALNKR